MRYISNICSFSKGASLLLTNFRPSASKKYTKGQEFGNKLMTRNDIENKYDFAVTQYLAVRRTAQRAYLFTP